MLKLKNPWERLKKSNDDIYVLNEDWDQLRTHNKHCNERDAFILDLIPEPFTGDPDAPIVILNTNPGFSPKDYETIKSLYFFQSAMGNLSFDLDPEWPFFMLNPRIIETPTYKWWNKTVSILSKNHIYMQTISQNIFCIRYVAYHSSRYNVSRNFTLPSTLYTKYLIEKAIQRNALILCQRSHQRFQKLVPSLIKYSNIYYSLNPQMPIISEYNYKEGFYKCLTLLNS